MYRLCFQRDFKARHFLIGGDWGPENHPHEHAYRLEWELSGAELDRHGYLVDLVDVEKALGQALGRYDNALLNDLPEFSGVNPSLERFARALWEHLADVLPGNALCPKCREALGKPAGLGRICDGLTRRQLVHRPMRHYDAAWRN